MKLQHPERVRLIAMDLDGTLTQHRETLTQKNREALDALAKKYKLLMVGAGQVGRIFRQMGEYPIDIIGNYGLQEGRYNPLTRAIDTVRDLSLPCEREAIAARVAALRERYGFTSFRGDGVEFHPSGCVTFPILGTAAIQAEKLAFDPDRRKRRAIYAEVVAAFPEYHVFVGGSSSFDMAPRPYNKYYALSLYAKGLGLSHEEILYIGDDYGRGGNDESVYLSDIPYLEIDDYRDFPALTAPLL